MTAGLSLADLRRRYYGGGSDAEYDVLDTAYEAGITAADVLDLVLNPPSPVDVEGALATTVVESSFVTGDAENRFSRDAAGKHSWGGGAGAADTNLYRSAADTLKTDDGFRSALEIRARDADSGGQVVIGRVTGSNQGGISFGSAADTNLYRQDANVLLTDDELRAVGNVRAKNGSSTATEMGAMGPGGQSGILFGSSGDVNLYRNNSSELRTSDNFAAELTIMANAGGTDRQVRIGYVGPGLLAGISFGALEDTVLYRSAANTLRTDDLFIANNGAITLSDAVLINGSGAGTAYIEGREQTADPAAPGADRYRLYCKDNGAGKTQLCVMFSDGAVHVLATMA